jgi:hypothetical protein
MNPNIEFDDVCGYLMTHINMEYFHIPRLLLAFKDKPLYVVQHQDQGVGCDFPEIYYDKHFSCSLHPFFRDDRGLNLTVDVCIIKLKELIIEMGLGEYWIE